MKTESTALRRLCFGAAIGFLVGLVAKELDLAQVVSYHGERARIVVASVAIGGFLGVARFERILIAGAVASGSLWLLVVFTPLTRWMGDPLVRKDPLQRADAVFVLASALQADGDLTTPAMSRLLAGLELLGDGWAPRLVLSELPLPAPRYRDAACELMDSFGMSQEILSVGPVSNTHDEAVLVGQLYRELGFERLLVVTSPSHSLRASLALEAEGVEVVSMPSGETLFDQEKLWDPDRWDDHLRAFGIFLHEHAGLLYYRHKGWIS
jgi:hypothetical protein